jgi:hypothetical protein
VSECRECAEWLADVTEMEVILSKVERHDPPESLVQRMQDAAQRSVPVIPTSVRAVKEINSRRLIVNRSLLLATCIVVAAGTALFSLTPGGGSIAAGDLRKAFQRLNVVHITGFEYESQKDKWVRAEPLAAYEVLVTPQSPKPMRRIIEAGNETRRYWYTPDSGNRALVLPGLTGGFLQQILSVIEPSNSQDGGLKIVGHSKLDGRDVDLLRPQEGDYVLSVDPGSKLTYRYQLFETKSDGTRVQVSDLRFDYGQVAPPNVFDWTPPKGAHIVYRRQLKSRQP